MYTSQKLQTIRGSFGAVILHIAIYNSESCNADLGSKKLENAVTLSYDDGVRFDIPSDWLKRHPNCHHNNTRLMELAKQFIEGERREHPAIFYLWEHTFEFDCDNNWEVIARFAEYISNRDNVWYSTNIEIYNYVTAYNRLETSFDKKIIHNPSAVDVWAVFGNEAIKIGAGETIKR